MEAANTTWRDRLVGFILFAGIFLYYFAIVPSFSVPGRWAGIAAAFSGLDPFPPIMRPVWSGLVGLLSSLPLANLGYAINLLTALAGAISCWLLYEIVRRIPFSRSVLSTSVIQREVEARRVAGVAAALYAAVSTPMITFSAYGDFAVTDMCLLLLAFYPLMLFREAAKMIHWYLSAFLMGLAVVEYPTAAMVLPFHAGVWLYLLWSKKKLNALSVCGGLALFAAGGLVLSLYLYRYLGSPAAYFREATDFLPLLGEFVRLYYLELTRAVPKVGWLLIIGMNLVPFVAVLVKELDEPMDRFTAIGVYAFRIVLVLVAIVTLFNLPGSPAHAMGSRVLLLAPAVMTAVWSGYLTGYYYGLFKYLPSRTRIGTNRRGAVWSWLVLVGWLAVLLFAGIRHGLAARVDDLAPVAQFADDVIADLNGRDFLLTDGMLDAQLYLAARQAGIKPNIINLQAAASPERARYYSGMFEDDSIRALAMIRISAALRDWISRNNGAMERVVLLASPELFRLPDVAVHPSLHFYVLQAHTNAPDAEMLLDRQITEQARRGLRALDRTESSDAGWFQREFVMRWSSRLANDTGYLLGERGKQALADEAFQLALAIWPENPSALLNRIESEAWSSDDPERRRLIEDFDKLAKENPAILNVRYLHGVSGRLRNPAAMLAYAQQSPEAGDSDELLRDIAVRVDRMDENALAKLAGLYLREQNPDESEAIFLSMLEVNPQNLDAYYGMFRLAMNRGSYDEAQALLTTMAALGADPEKQKLDRADLLLSTGKLDEARRLYTDITRLDKAPPEAWMGLAQVGIRLDDQDLIDLAFASLEREPNYVPGLIMLGDRAILKGRLDQARGYHARALVLSPGDERILLRLMYIVYEQRDAEGLRQYSGQLLSFDPDHPEANLMAAYVHIAGSAYDLAEAALRRSLRGRQTSRALNELAWVLSRQDKNEEALPWAVKAHETDPRNYQALDTLAMIRFKLGQLDEAAANISEALEISGGKNSGVRLNAAEIYVAAGRHPDAENALKMPDDLFSGLNGDQRDRWRRLRAAIRL